MTQTATHSTYQGRPLKRRQPIQFGDDVEMWQKKMKSRGWNIDVDAQYGLQSENVCKKFQREKGLPETGIVDKTTWDACLKGT